MIDLCVFDLETTGVDAHNDRIVTAVVALLDRDGNVTRQKDWIVDPGVPIPTGASDVHGWTKENLDAEETTRHDPAAVTREIASLIWQVCGNTSTPLVGHNVSYDLTMLNAHLVRDRVGALPFGLNNILVLDSLVLDKHYDKYVKGSGQRKLTPTAARYGVQLSAEEAHNAANDAIASGRITQAILRRYVPYVVDTPFATLGQLHRQQAAWYLEQQAGLERWLRKTDPSVTTEKDWPTHQKEAA